MLAVKLIGHSGAITRFHSPDHYPSSTGTAPVDTSSAPNTRQRVNRGGNRALNTAIHLVARTRPADPAPAAPTTNASSPKARPQPGLPGPQAPDRQGHLPVPGRPPHPPPPAHHRLTFSRVDIQALAGHSADRWVPSDALQKLADGSTSRHQAGETSGQTSHGGHPPGSSKGELSIRVQGRPRGRSPSAAGPIGNVSYPPASRNSWAGRRRAASCRICEIM